MTQQDSRAGDAGVASIRRAAERLREDAIVSRAQSQSRPRDLRDGSGVHLTAEALEKLGVVTAWDAAKSDSTAMAPASETFVISEACDRAFVAVDKGGTEAAAATAVAMKAGNAAPSAEPVPFVVDHPFLFLVRDTKTGAILFLGRLVDP